MKPERDRFKAWNVDCIDGEWFWYNDQGEPSLPYTTQEGAMDGLDDYDASYYD